MVCGSVKPCQAFSEGTNRSCAVPWKHELWNFEPYLHFLEDTVIYIYVYINIWIGSPTTATPCLHGQNASARGCRGSGRGLWRFSRLRVGWFKGSYRCTEMAKICRSICRVQESSSGFKHFEADFFLCVWTEYMYVDVSIYIYIPTTRMTSWSFFYLKCCMVIDSRRWDEQWQWW